MSDLFKGNPRESWDYIGSHQDVYEKWVNHEITTYGLQFQTPPGEGTASLVLESVNMVTKEIVVTVTTEGNTFGGSSQYIPVCLLDSSGNQLARGTADLAGRVFFDYEGVSDTTLTAKTCEYNISKEITPSMLSSSGSIYVSLNMPFPRGSPTPNVNLLGLSLEPADNSMPVMPGEDVYLNLELEETNGVDVIGETFDVSINDSHAGSITVSFDGGAVTTEQDRYILEDPGEYVFSVGGESTSITVQEESQEPPEDGTGDDGGNGGGDGNGDNGDTQPPQDGGGTDDGILQDERLLITGGLGLSAAGYLLTRGGNNE